MANNSVKEELELQAQKPVVKQQQKQVTIADTLKIMEPEIKKALPAVITPERFMRIAMSAVSNTPELKKCTPISFISALLNAAQLGLEPNTPLGQAYLIPYKNKGTTECQFQIGYKGLIDLAYRNSEIKTIQAHTVYENDDFDYEFGLNERLVHKPCKENRGEPVFYYAIFKTINDGYGMAVMSREQMDEYGKKYSKSFASNYSPWQTNYESMALKTVLKQALKYAPIKADFQRAISTDMSIKNQIDSNMVDVTNEMEYEEV